MNLALKTHRLTTIKQPADRYLTCQINNSSDENEPAYGHIISLIEILTPWPPSPKVSQALISTVVREYCRASNATSDEKFENALKRANETLTHYTQNGDTEWIGNTNAVFALLTNEALHVTAVGHPYVLLLRDGNLVNVIQDILDNSQEELHPLRTFANITSGEIKFGDVLIFASSNLLTYLAQDEIQQIIEFNPLGEAALEIVEHIREKGELNINLLLVEVSDKDELAKEPVSDIPPTIYLDQINESLLHKIKSATKRHVIPKAASTAHAAKHSGKILAFWTKDKIAPALKNTAQKISSSKHFPLKKKEPPASTDIEPYPEPGQVTTYEADAAPSDNLAHTPQKSSLADGPLHVHHYGKRSFWVKLKSAFGAIFRTLRYGLMSFFQLARKPSGRVLLFRIGIALLVIILAFSIVIKLRHLSANKPSPQVSISLPVLEGKYESALSMDPKEAAPLLQSIAESLTADGPPKGDALALYNKTIQRLDAITRTARLTIPSAILSLPKNTQNFFISGLNIYAVTTNGDIFQGPANAPSLEKATSLPSGSGNVTFSSGPTTAKNIIIATSKPAFFEFSTASSTVKTIATNDDNWKTPAALSSFTNNLYIIDNQEGSLWKYTPSQSKYSKAQLYSKQSQNAFPKALSLTVDGNLYILKSDFSVSKLTRSELLPFTLNDKEIPTPSQKPHSPKSIVTQEEGDQIFFVEEHRVLSYNKNGNYEKEYLMPEKSPAIKAIFIQPVLRKLWIAYGDNLFFTSF